MRYPYGRIARTGDRGRLWSGAEGIVVCSLDTDGYLQSNTHPLIYINARTPDTLAACSMADDPLREIERLKCLAAWYRSWAVLAENAEERANRLRLADGVEEEAAALSRGSEQARR